MLKLSNVPVRILINPPSLIWFIKYLVVVQDMINWWMEICIAMSTAIIIIILARLCNDKSFVFNAVTNGLWVLVFYFPVLSYFSRLMIWFLINLNGFPDTHINWGFRWIGEEISRRRLLYQSINQWLPLCKSPPPKLHYNYPEKEAHWGGKLVDRRVIDPCLVDGRAAIHPLCSIYSTSPINVRSLQLWRFSGQRRWMCQRSWLFNMASAYQPRTRSLFGELN